MKDALALTFSAIFLLLLGAFLGTKIEQQKVKPKLRTPEIIVSEVARLYSSKIYLPDGVLIGIPGKDSTEAFIFTFEDPIKGLQYVGVFKLRE